MELGQAVAHPGWCAHPGWGAMSWNQNLFCFILTSLKPAMGSYSALLFPHAGGDRLCPTSGAKCRVWSLEKTSPYPFPG